MISGSHQRQRNPGHIKLVMLQSVRKMKKFHSQQSSAAQVRNSFLEILAVAEERMIMDLFIVFNSLFCNT
jgi:hypothetical protein